MSPRLRAAAPLALVALSVACVPSYRYTVRAMATAAPACRFRGRWAYGELLGGRSRVAFADVSGAAAEGALEREPAGPTLRLVLRARGWTLRGVADLAAGHTLRPQRAVALGDVLTAHPGADVIVRDARPGEALVAPGRFAFGRDHGDVRFVVDPARWVACDALGFDFTFRDEHTEERERVAMGFAADLPAREIAPALSVDLAATPGGAAQVRVNPRSYGLTLRPLSTEGPFTRVLLQHWTSLALVAWLPTAALSDESEGGGGGIMGGLGSSERRALTVCRAPVEVTFAFTHAGSPLEYAGSVSAGTEFVRGARTTDGGFVISPYPRGSSPHAARDVTWVAHALAPRVFHRDLRVSKIVACPDASLVGRSFDDVARERGEDAVAVFLDLCAEHGDALRWFTTIANDRPEHLRNILAHPDILVGFSDAGAHLRNMAFYNYALFMLRIARDAARDGVPFMDIARAVHRCTGEIGQWLGLDAGVLGVGRRADLVVIDPAHLDAIDTIEEERMPEFGGFSRMVRRNAAAVPLVVVRGRVAVRDGAPVEAVGRERGFGQFLPAGAVTA